MALDAVHIRADGLLSEDEDANSAGWQHRSRSGAGSVATNERRSTSPPPNRSSRPGIGSSSGHPDLTDEDTPQWHSLRTGESLASRALRMRDRFVKATHLSDPTLEAPYESEVRQEPTSGQHLLVDLGSETPSAPAIALEAPTATLAQLYSQLTRDIPATDGHHQPLPVQLPHSTLSPSTSRSDIEHGHPMGRDSQRAHHHRHQPDTRHRSEWFITRAFNKMRRSQHANSSTVDMSTGASRGVDTVLSTELDREHTTDQRGGRCPRCGDLMPRNASPEYMARHRQSIGHRLGLNAPVSSASASEAPSPTSSEPTTPAIRSRATSPSDASMLTRRSDKVPRRLSNAPRWKKLTHDNVGHTLLSRMGWKEGMGLGVQEWKWQQVYRDKVKRQRSNAVRALLVRRASSSQSGLGVAGQETFLQAEEAVAFRAHPDAAQEEPEWLRMLVQPSLAATAIQPSPLQTAFPFQLEGQSIDQQREAAQMWLSNPAQADAEWLHCLTPEELQSLEQALLSGQITLQEVHDALWIHSKALSAIVASDQQTDHASSSGNGEIADDAMQSDALLYPVEVELRKDRRGIGAKRPFAETDTSNSQRRRSRAAEGSVEIRRQSSPSIDLPDGGLKRSRSASASRPFRSTSRSRSRSGTGSSRQVDKRADLTRRQRELAYQQDKRDWLDLRASLS